MEAWIPTRRRLQGTTPLSCRILWAGILRGVLGSYGEDSYGRDRIRYTRSVRGHESYGRVDTYAGLGSYGRGGDSYS